MDECRWCGSHAECGPQCGGEEDAAWRFERQREERMQDEAKREELAAVVTTIAEVAAYGATLTHEPTQADIDTAFERIVVPRFRGDREAAERFGYENASLMDSAITLGQARGALERQRRAA